MRMWRRLAIVHTNITKLHDLFGISAYNTTKLSTLQKVWFFKAPCLAVLPTPFMHYCSWHKHVHLLPSHNELATWYLCNHEPCAGYWFPTKQQQVRLTRKIIALASSDRPFSPFVLNYCIKISILVQSKGLKRDILKRSNDRVFKNFWIL